MASVSISSAGELLRQDWYSDHKDPRCPHDAWIENIILREAVGLHVQDRTICIEIHAINAYHTGKIIFKYQNVRSYTLTLLSSSDEGNMGHRDLLDDSFEIKREGLSRHQMMFSGGAVVVILFEKFSFEAFWDEV